MLRYTTLNSSLATDSVVAVSDAQPSDDREKEEKEVRVSVDHAKIGSETNLLQNQLLRVLVLLLHQLVLYLLLLIGVCIHKLVHQNLLLDRCNLLLLFELQLLLLVLDLLLGSDRTHVGI